MTTPRRRTLRLRRPLRRAIERGHPWIYDRALGAVDATAGEVVAIADDRGPFATAFVDPDRPLRARVLALDPELAVDRAWAAERARLAASHRRLPPELAATDAVRAIHGENDGLPGLTIDVYAGVAVVVFDGGAAAAFWRPRLDAVLDGVRAGGLAITGRWLRPTRGDGGGGSGDDVPALVPIHEGPARFAVDVRHGQKTGFFLDQRANRARVGALCGGASVLNLCAYTGGFSVWAGLGGARQVTSVDLAPRAIAQAEAHWRDNGLPLAAHTGETADVFAFLDRAVAARRRWDVVIADPPSFAPSEAARPRALAAYGRLAAAALAVTTPGGLLVLASCSSHVHDADLRELLATAAGRRPLQVVESRGAAADHPTCPGFPEGRYLDLLICAA